MDLKDHVTNTRNLRSQESEDHAVLKRLRGPAGSDEIIIRKTPNFRLLYGSGDRGQGRSGTGSQNDGDSTYQSQGVNLQLRYGSNADGSSSENDDSGSLLGNTSLAVIYGLPIALLVVCVCLGRLFCKQRRHNRRFRGANGQYPSHSRFCCWFICDGLFHRRVASRETTEAADANAANGNQGEAEAKDAMVTDKYKLGLEKVKTSVEEEQCKICFLYKRDALLEPCGHSMCHVCLDKMTKCPFCRAVLTGAKPLKTPPTRKIFLQETQV